MNETEGAVIHGYSVYTFAETDETDTIWGYEIWRGPECLYYRKPYASRKADALTNAKQLLDGICDSGSVRKWNAGLRQAMRQARYPI